MKKLFLASILFLILLVPASSMARTDVFLNFGLGIPAPVFTSPSPVVAPPSVIVQSAPVIVGHPVWHKHHKHIKFERED